MLKLLKARFPRHPLLVREPRPGPLPHCPLQGLHYFQCENTKWKINKKSQMNKKIKSKLK